MSDTQKVSLLSGARRPQGNAGGLCGSQCEGQRISCRRAITSRRLPMDAIPSSSCRTGRCQGLEPIVVGGGRPLFNEAPSITMTLVNVNTLDRGAVALRYVPHTAGTASQP